MNFYDSACKQVRLICPVVTKVKEVKHRTMKKTVSIFLLLMGVLTSVSGQTEVSPFRPGSTLEGVNYFLPKTLFKVVVVAEKHTTIPGEYAGYADRYLRLRDVPTQQQDTWTVKSVTLYPFGVPDASKAYNIKVKSKTSAPLVSLTDDGLLLAINTEAEPEPLPELPKAVPAPKPVNGRDYMTQEILAAGSSAKMAQLTAEEIYDIRDSRNALLRGEADNTPKDGAQLKLMLDGLAEQLNALESLFKGQTLTSTEVFTFDYDPTGLLISESGSEEPLSESDDAVEDVSGGKKMATEGRALLCRFSKRLGLVDADDLSGEPFWIDLKLTGNLPASDPNADVQRKQAKMEKGVWVNQPARALVSVSNAEGSLCTLDVLVPQFGTTEVLSSALFDKKPETRVTFHQHIGSVKRLE